MVAWSLVVAALILTPFAAFMLALGQTSPLLVLAAVMSIGAANQTRWSGSRLGLVLAAAGAFKAFPLVMLAVPASRRQWRLIVWTAVWLGLLIAVLARFTPLSLWSDFLATARIMTRGATDNAYNSSIDSALNEFGIASGVVVWAYRAAIITIIIACRRSLRDVEVRWAVAWVTVLVLFPQVWGHYSMVAFAAVGTLVARHTAPRTVLAMPVAAALLLPVALIDSDASGAVTMRLVINLLEFALVLWLATGRERPIPPPRKAAKLAGV
jgi:hypothetical protein